MKQKVIGLILVVLMILGSAGCAQKAPTNNTPVRVVTLKGPTGMGMAALMEANAQGKSRLQYEFTLVASPEEAAAQVIAGQADVAAVATNLAATLYKKTEGNVRLAAVATLGVLYLVGRDGAEVNSIADLAGKTVTLAGQGATPEYVLNDLLAAEGIAQEVTLDFRSEHAEAATRLLAGETDLALLPEPQVTAAMLKDESLRVVLDLNELFIEAHGGDALPMGSVILTADMAAQTQRTQDFLADYRESVESIQADADAAGELIAKYEIMAAAPAAKKALPRCNIVCITGEEMVTLAKNYFQVLYEAAPAAIGGAMPEEGLYLQ